MLNGYCECGVGFLCAALRTHSMTNSKVMRIFRCTTFFSISTTITDVQHACEINSVMNSCYSLALSRYFLPVVRLVSNIH